METQAKEMQQRLPTGIKIVAVFFGFGACMCALTIILLLFPGSALDALWRLNREAALGFYKIGTPWAVVLMAAVGTACACAAAGLMKRKPWGRRLAILILAVNLVADSLNALLRHDLRILVGLPIGGLIIWYLRKVGRMERLVRVFWGEQLTHCEPVIFERSRLGRK